MRILITTLAICTLSPHPFCLGLPPELNPNRPNPSRPNLLNI